MADRHIQSPLHPRTLLIWPAKTPEGVLDYGFDWTDALLSPAERARHANGETVAPADGIQQSDYALPPGLVASGSSNTATSTAVTIAGGVDGQVYRVVHRIRTAAGRVLERTVKLRVRAR